MIKVSAIVSVGRDKAICEDAALVGSQVICDKEFICELEFPSCICIADGVGGNIGGDMASRYVLNCISGNSPNKLDRKTLTEYIEKINKSLLSFASHQGIVSQMATTLTGLFVDRDSYWYVQSGNTRMYAMQGKYLKQITKDQTTYQWLMETGNTEAAIVCNKNEITGCLGGGTEKYSTKLVVDETFKHYLPHTILLTSDGIHEYVETDILEKILQSSIEDIDIARNIVSKALDMGSGDDRTVVIIRL
ncbi:serine/threonine-protein phosphatase [Clostridium sp. AF15-17LB]|nr:serine/threonine-protein phosphatase [Clostridium sp. AF15-17LB]